MFVKEVKAKLIRNSRKEATIEISLETYEGKFKASSPSGKSRGVHEVEPWNRRGIKRSLKMVRVFAKRLKHVNFLMKKVDDLQLLRTEIGKFEARHGRLGGNVTCALDIVFLRAAAKEKKKELWEFIYDSSEKNSRKKPKMPMPVGNCVGGGVHSKLTRGKKPDFQEFLLIPKTKEFSKAVTKMVHAYHHAKSLLKARGREDEGAWMTDKTNEEVLFILRKVGQRFGVKIGIDAAASIFYKKGYYLYKNKELIRDKLDQAEYIERLINKYKLFYVEDGLQEEDFGGFKEVVNALDRKDKKTLVVGDDLTTTNLARVRRAVRSGSMNAVIIKPNQIGSILEVSKVVDFCKKNKIKTVFSHRSGETMDDSLGDLAVGFGADFIKCGIYGRERLVKLKRIMDIEKGLKR
jgi:enolase